MTYVSPARKIANPIKSAYRIWHSFRPFLDGGIRFREPHWTLYQQVKKDAKAKIRGTKPLEIYYLTNKWACANIDKLHNSIVVWVPGTSINLTPEDNLVGARPASQGMDFVSDVLTLPDALLRATALVCKKFEEDYGLETKIYGKLKIIPVNACVAWIWDIKKEGGWRFVPTFEQELLEISGYFTAQGKFGYETFERRLDLPDEFYEETGVIGNYEWSTRVVNPHKAKIYGDDPKLIENLTYIIKKILGKAYSTIAAKGPHQTFAYLKKTGAERAILEQMPKTWHKKIYWIGGDGLGQGVMRNTQKRGHQLTAQGESHPSAISIYAGWLYHLAEQEYLLKGGKIKPHNRFSDANQASLGQWATT